MSSIEALLANLHELPTKATLDAKMAVRDGMIERGGDADNFAVLSVDGQGATDTCLWPIVISTAIQPECNNFTLC